MEISYDLAKNENNIAVRQLSFEQVVAFDFSTALIKQDVRKPYPETRYVAVGFLGNCLHVLCFTPIATGIRVISFRKANPREVKNYEQTNPID